MNNPTNSSEIIELEHAYWRAIQERDLETALQLTDDTCVVTGAQGFASIDKKVFASMMKSEHWKLHKYEFLGEPVVRFVSPELALIAYKVREEMTVEGRPLTLEAADSSAWSRADGKWRCVLHTESLIGDSFGRDRVTKPPTAESLAQQDAVANLAVKDLKTAQNFYENTVGLTPVGRHGDEVVVYKSGNSRVNVYRSKFAGTNQATAVTWSVSDIEGVVKDLKSKGVTFEHYEMPGTKLEGDVHVSSGMKVAWFRDPDGNILNLIGS